MRRGIEYIGRQLATTCEFTPAEPKAKRRKGAPSQAGTSLQRLDVTLNDLGEPAC